MYCKNISLHLAYLQTNEKKNYFCKQKIRKIVIFFKWDIKSSIWFQNAISSKFFKNLCLYYIHFCDVMPKKLFIICKII